MSNEDRRIEENIRAGVQRLFKEMSMSASRNAALLQQAIDDAAMASLLNIKGPSPEQGQRIRRSHGIVASVGSWIYENGEQLDRSFPDRDPRGGVSQILRASAHALESLSHPLQSLEIYSGIVTRRILTSAERDKLTKHLREMAEARDTLVALSDHFSRVATS